MKQLFKIFERFGARAFRRTLESPRCLIGLLNKVQLVIFRSLTKERCIAVYLFVRWVMRFSRKSGWLYTSIDFQAFGHALQVSYGGDFDKHLRYATWISLSRSGIPTCIPVHHRRVISGKGSRGDVLVRFYLSLFSISKLVLLVPKRAKCNYSSIIKDFEPDCGFQSLVELLFYKSTLPSVVISPPSLRFQWRLDFSGDHAGRRSRPPAV